MPYQLTTATPGIFDNLELRETDRPKPAPNEVEIEVVAGGLNFIDVMKSLGIYPGMAAGSILFGGECAGRISALGSEVREFTLGQRVVAMSSGERGCFARFVVTRAAMVAPLPERLTFEQGATIPAVFLTAHYAMNTLGHLSAGERVLIHSATGGVGLAAVQLARRAGAEIFATAGNPEKRAFLHELGIEHVFDSRSTAFAGEIRRVTEGSEVDMVLNSLAGDAIAESLDLLRDDGRFLEIGKRDIYQDAALGLAPFKRGLSFSHVDLGRLVRDRADKMGALLRELLGMFEAGELEPLPTTRFPISEAPEAFRFMAQAKHIGKIVLSTEDPQLDARVLPSAELARADGTYLITGGLGGLGLLVAEWLAGQGARHLLLLGRSKPSAQASERIEGLRQRGVTVSVQACDVSRAEQLDEALAVAQAQLPPLRGVLHAAAVLDDGVALQLTPERFWKAMGPKLLGAWNLHASTRQLPLDFFVVFSSAAAAVGSPGQANYAAGNEFMDALAHARRAAGLVALSIDWGPWRESGIAAGSQRAGRLGTRGMGSFSDADGLELLGKLMRSERTQVVAVANADFQVWTQFYPSVARGGLLEEVLRKKAATPAQDSTTRREILDAPAEQRIERVVAHVSRVLRRVLRISDAKQLDLDVPLNRFGIDSLMAVELKNRLESDLGVTITVSKILLSTGMQQLAGELLALMTKEEAATPLAAATAPVQDTGGALERLFSDLDDGSDLLDEELIEEKRMSA